MSKNFNLKTVAAAAVFSLALAGCATVTPYAPAKGLGNGYTDTKLEPGKHRVTFKGNSTTDLATVENYLLLRAAELTVAEGHGHFVILDEGESGLSTFRSFSNGFGGGRFGRRGFFGGGFGGGFGTATTSTRERRAYNVNVIIQSFEGLKPEEMIEAFNAQDVINNLGPIVTRPS